MLTKMQIIKKFVCQCTFTLVQVLDVSIVEGSDEFEMGKEIEGHGPMKCYDFEIRDTVVGWPALATLFLCDRVYFLSTNRPATQPTQHFCSLLIF